MDGWGLMEINFRLDVEGAGAIEEGCWGDWVHRVSGRGVWVAVVYERISGIGDSWSSSDTGCLLLGSWWHCFLIRLSFFTLILLNIIISISIFIRSWLPEMIFGNPEESCAGGIRDMAVLFPGAIGCFPLAPEGWDMLLTILWCVFETKVWRESMSEYERLSCTWLSGAEIFELIKHKTSCFKATSF